MKEKWIRARIITPYPLLVLLVCRLKSLKTISQETQSLHFLFSFDTFSVTHSATAYANYRRAVSFTQPVNLSFVRNRSAQRKTTILAKFWY